MDEPGRFCLAIVVIVAAALCWPIWQTHWFGSHEGQGYVLRTLEFASELERGVLYPRWCPDFYGGYGSPFFVFYAPGVYAAAAFATLLGASVVVGLKLVITVASIAAGLGCFWFVRAETRRNDAALVASALFLASPYRLSNLFVRGDLAEFTALALLPCVLVLYRSMVRADSLDTLPLSGTLAALAHAAMILTHTLTGLWGTELVGIVLVAWSWSLLRRRAHVRLASLALTFVFALAISAVYTMPALLEKPLVRIELMTQGGGNVVHNWLHTKQLIQPGMFDVRLLGVAVVVAALALALRRRAGGAVIGWLGLALACVVLCLPIASFVWKSGVLPFGAMIQFPWRLLGFASLCAALATGLSWAQVFPANRIAPLAAAAVAGGLLLGSLPRLAVEPKPRAEIADGPDWIRARVLGATDNDEYLPRAAEAPKAPRKRLILSSERVVVQRQESSGSEHHLEVKSEARGSLTLGLHHYPGWSVHTQAGPSAVELASTSNGLVALSLPKPGRYVMSVRFTSTPLRTAMGFISFLSALLAFPALRGLVRALSGRPQRRPAPIEPSFDGLPV